MSAERNATPPQEPQETGGNKERPRFLGAYFGMDPEQLRGKTYRAGDTHLDDNIRDNTIPNIPTPSTRSR